MQKKTDVTEEDVDKLMAVFGELNSTQVWSRVERKDFTVKRFAMGYVNDIACCTLTAEAQKRLCRSSADLPAIVVKFSPPELFFEQSRIEIAANNTIISENNLCPRLIYIDEKTIINEYIQCRNYNVEDDLDEKTVRQLAAILARFHSLKSPVSRNGFKKWEKMNEDLSKVPGADEVLEKKYLQLIAAEPELNDKFYGTFANLEIMEEMKHCKEAMKFVGSPLVFSHSDFNRGNRLVKEEKSADGTVNKTIYLVDFDYSTYNYRGYDLGRYFSNYRHVDDMFGNEGIPSDEEMKLFLEEYRQCCGRMQGEFYLKQERNSIDQLIRETKVFLLNALTIDYFFCLMMFVLNPTGEQKTYFLQSAKNRYEAFKEVKQRVIDDGTLSAVMASNGSA